ncbi:hypothetical protein TSUD_354720 [Trifolium subterraneum]|uniref:Uncharacterized protein n=1 Tax=Trifolium subterraneum TaxID=3900 RepID=A0A2Z6NN60_TRISU|nr:hypothetical protein TSUD_354720 [Trifolium subterraneum]
MTTSPSCIAPITFHPWKIFFATYVYNMVGVGGIVIFFRTNIHVSISPPPEGALKCNVDDSFLEDSLYLGAGGVVHNHEDD